MKNWKEFLWLLAGYFLKVRFILQLHIICFFKLELILHVLLPRAIQFKTSSNFSYWVEIRYEVDFSFMQVAFKGQ